MTLLVNIRVTSQKALVSGGCGEPFVLGTWPRLVRIKAIRLLNGVAERDFSVQLHLGGLKLFSESSFAVDLANTALPSPTIQLGVQVTLQAWYTGLGTAVFDAAVYLYT